MTMDEIREFAQMLGVLSVYKFNGKRELIRTIQLANGEEDCFFRGMPCGNERCMWHGECQSPDVSIELR